VALLGWYGSLTLYREWPEPAVLQGGDFEEAAGQWRLSLDDAGWWSGDRVTIHNPRGLPIDFNGDGFADCPDGHRFYGPPGFAGGPATRHRTSDSSQMYRTPDRLAPGTVVVTRNDIVQVDGQWGFYLDDTQWRTGDPVRLTAPSGLPIGGSGSTTLPDAYRFYGPLLPTEIEAAHRLNNAAPMYRLNVDTFFTSAIPGTVLTVLECFVRLDANGHATFYDTREHAHAGGTDGLLPLQPVFFGPLTIEPIWELPDNSKSFYDDVTTVGYRDTATVYIRRDQMDRVSFYTSAFAAVNGGISGLLPMNHVGFGDMTVMPAWDDTDGWKQVCNIQQFAIDIDPSNLDTAAIGEEFGSYVRGMVRGAGSINGQMSNKYVEGTTNTARLAKLALLTRKGSMARARFQLSPGDTDNCAPDPPLFYEADILLGQTTVQLNVTEVITVQSQFVMTTEPKLVMDFGDPVLPPVPEPASFRIKTESGDGLVVTRTGGAILLDA
jgi:hypothetical protein